MWKRSSKDVALQKRTLTCKNYSGILSSYLLGMKVTWDTPLTHSSPSSYSIAHLHACVALMTPSCSAKKLRPLAFSPLSPLKGNRTVSLHNPSLQIPGSASREPTVLAVENLVMMQRNGWCRRKDSLAPSRCEDAARGSFGLCTPELPVDEERSAEGASC